VGSVPHAEVARVTGALRPLREGGSG